MGYDVNNGDIEDLLALSRELVRHGITSYVPSTISLPHEDIVRVCNTVGKAITTWTPDKGSRILGLHLEGPYISVEKRGVHRIEYIREPSIEELEEYISSSNKLIRQITLAPEKKNALELIKYSVENDIVVSIGHTNASYEETMKAIIYGASKATHIFNAMKPIHHRDPGPIIALLETPSIYIEVIADYVHVSKPVLKFLLNHVGIDRVVLVSDLVPIAGLPDGEYEWAGIKIVVEKNIPRTRENKVLVGGFNTLDKLVRNIHNIGCNICEAIQTASYNPARSINALEKDKVGLLKPGFKADLIVLDEQLNVLETYIEGNLVYSTEI